MFLTLDNTRNQSDKCAHAGSPRGVGFFWNSCILLLLPFLRPLYGYCV